MHNPIKENWSLHKDCMCTIPGYLGNPFLRITMLSWEKKKKKKTWTSGLASSPWGRPEGKSGRERIKLSTEVPKRKVLSTTDLGALCWFGRVHVNNKLWPQGFSATPQATLPVGNFALRSRSPGQRMVEAKAETVVPPFLICRQEGPIRAQATSSFHLSSFNWKVGMAIAPISREFYEA